MRLLAACLSLLFWSAPLGAAEKIDRLMDALRLSEVVEILQQEGKVQARELNETFLGGAGGDYFETRLEEIYDPDWMRNQIKGAFKESLTDSQLDRAILFFESELGQTIVALENSARLAFQDETIKEMAQYSYSSDEKTSQSYRLIDEYIEVNDLIEKNVQSTLSADYNFFRGLGEDTGLDDGEFLAQLLTEKDNVRRETETWLYSFLLMAFQPLTETQMRENIAFSRTETGRAVNEAFFIGFDRMYDEIYYRLGRAAFQVLNGSDL